MSKYHKKNKRKKTSRKINYSGSVEGFEKEFGELLYITKPTDFENESEILETPFGQIVCHEDAFTQYFLNRKVLIEILKAEKEIDKENNLSRLIQYEKLGDKFPKEPIIAFEIAECYNKLKKTGKYEKLTKTNFEQFRGCPSIDISYAHLLYDSKEDMEIADQLFGNNLNLHGVYPKTKAFDDNTILKFYSLLSNSYRHKKDFDLAEQCAEVVEIVFPAMAQILSTRIKFDKNPWYRWRTLAEVFLIIGAIIALIIGLIWGIIAFFQWLF